MAGKKTILHQSTPIVTIQSSFIEWGRLFVAAEAIGIRVDVGGVSTMSNPTNRLILNLVQTIIGWATDEPNIERIQSGIQSLSNDSSNPLNLSNTRQMSQDVSMASSSQHNANAPVASNESSNTSSSLGFDALLDAARISASQEPHPKNDSTSVGTMCDSAIDAQRQDLHHADNEPLSLHTHPACIDRSCNDGSPSQANNDLNIDGANVDYPNGNVTIKHGYRNHKISWCMDSYSTHTSKTSKKIYKKCLGVFECSEMDCDFVSRVKPNVKKKQGFQPVNTTCKSHPDSNLRHIPCQATIVMTYPIGDQCVVITNKGYHSHARPPKI